MKKKLTAALLCVCMLAIALIGGTLAYFTDEDQASNTFELGDVDITLTEKAYKNGAWVEIENPDGTAKLGQLDPGVAQSFNKAVFTINNEDAAYIRNYIAVETLDRAYNISEIIINDVDSTGSEAENKRHGCVIEKQYDNVKIGDKLFNIFVFDTIGDEAVESGNSFLTMTTVSLKKEVTEDDAEELGDFEIYTYSEAIQKAGLSHADAMDALIGEDETLEKHAINVMTNLIVKD